MRAFNSNWIALIFQMDTNSLINPRFYVVHFNLFIKYYLHRLKLLNQLVGCIQQELKNQTRVHYDHPPIYQLERVGDVKHSQADIRKARAYLGYESQFCLQEGIKKTMAWYLQKAALL